MGDLRHIRTLEEICDIVADEMNARNTKLTGHSFFLKEIAEVEPQERTKVTTGLCL